jgi:hypothetical protein
VKAQSVHIQLVAEDIKIHTKLFFFSLSFPPHFGNLNTHTKPNKNHILGVAAEFRSPPEVCFARQIKIIQAKVVAYHKYESKDKVSLADDY